MTTFHCINVAMPDINAELISQWVNDVARSYGRTAGNITYVFCDDAKILEVNRQYLNHDYYTDIITFDYTEGERIGGDLFISLDTVESNSQQQQTDPREELHRVIIHGILHLCGLKDKAPHERAQMEQAEDQALVMLQKMGAPKV